MLRKRGATFPWKELGGEDKQRHENDPPKNFACGAGRSKTEGHWITTSSKIIEHGFARICRRNFAWDAEK